MWHYGGMGILSVIFALSMLLSSGHQADAAQPLAGAEAAVPSAKEFSRADWHYLSARLKKAHFKAEFITALRNSYEPDDFRQVVELNLLLFLRKTDQHGVQVTDEANDRIQDFMSENQEALKTAERKYGVPGPVVSSLLWMESRYGENTGRFHVASVFLDLLQAERSQVLKDLKAKSVAKFSANPSRKDLKSLNGRAKKKAAWALKELKAIEKIYLAKNHESLKTRGSFAGAFGIPQFLPSSYLKWAKATKAHSSPNLSQPSDAIQSVAFYLSQNGWRLREKTHVRALMNYNNSRDYANAILRMAERADRKVASSDSSKEQPAN